MLGSVFAIDFSLRLNPGVAIPLQKYYKPAFNMTVQGDVLLFDLVSAGLEGGLLMEKPNQSDFPVTFLYGGLGVGVYHNLFSRFYAGAGGGLVLIPTSSRKETKLKRLRTFTGVVTVNLDSALIQL